MLKKDGAPIYMALSGDLARTQTKLVHCRAIVVNTRRNVVINPLYIGINTVLCLSMSYVTRHSSYYVEAKNMLEPTTIAGNVYDNNKTIYG